MTTEGQIDLTYEQFREKLVEVLGERFAAAHPTTSLYDELGVDSLEAWEMVAITEALAGARWGGELPHMYVVGDVFNFYRALRRSGGESLSPVSDADLDAIKELALGLRRDGVAPRGTAV